MTSNKFQGKPCKKCGGTERYISGKTCVACKMAQNKVNSRYESTKRYHIKRKFAQYGITPNQYNDMLVDQNHLCAICSRHKSNFQRGLAVDHNHSTGSIRKLLCPPCNMALGHLQENLQVAKNMVRYISEEC